MAAAALGSTGAPTGARPPPSCPARDRLSFLSFCVYSEYFIIIVLVICSTTKQEMEVEVEENGRFDNNEIFHVKSIAQA